MHPSQKRRLKEQAVKRSRLDHEIAIQGIYNRLMEGLQREHVQIALDRLWSDRAQYRKALKHWIDLGGVSIVARLGRLYQIAQVGTIHEQKWLVAAIADIRWQNPPLEIIQDSVTYDIQIKVRSLKNKKGRKGTGNPYEWVREDIMSVERENAPNATRAHIVQTSRASDADLARWLIKSSKKLVATDDKIALIEDRIHRSRSSGHAYSETPEGRWMGVDFSGSYPFMTKDKLDEFRRKEAEACAKGLIDEARQYPT